MKTNEKTKKHPSKTVWKVVKKLENGWGSVFAPSFARVRYAVGRETRPRVPETGLFAFQSFEAAQLYFDYCIRRSVCEEYTFAIFKAQATGVENGKRWFDWIIDERENLQTAFREKLFDDPYVEGAVTCDSITLIEQDARCLGTRIR